MADEDVKTVKMPKLNSLMAQKDPEFKYVEPDEWYIGIFEEAKLEKGQFGPYIKFFFKLDNGEYTDGTPAKGHKISTIMDAVLSPSKQLWEWASVMMGKEPVLGKDFDLTAYYGEKFRVLIKDKKKKKDSDKRYQVIATIKRREKKKEE